MIKVKLQKQNGKNVEFIKEIEFQALPKENSIITVDGNEYNVRSIKFIDSDIIITVRGKKQRPRERLWH